MSIKERLRNILKKKNIGTGVLTMGDILPEVGTKQNDAFKPRHAPFSVRPVAGGRYEIIKKPGDDY